MVDAFNRRLVQREVALQTGPGNVRGVPVAVQGTVLFNAARSYERFLLGLFFPALLLLAAAMAMVSAFGREFRDTTASDWLHSADGRMSVAVIGKLLPYIALFMLYGMAGILWICARSGAPAGSLLMLAAGQAALYAAYGAVALLLVGATRDMGTSLSVMGLYAGTAMAFSAGTFPMLEAPLFARVWSTLLPFSHYVKLQAQQLDMGSAWTVSLWPLAMLLLFVVIAGGLGLKMVMRALPAHAGGKSS
ncbi:ABC transporter permease [Marilutibacter alkalisoli]|uniref:ABC transporter permease n=1 Tax=Marilutibacter alkalisoli TaxID=2591633 RepID=UPI0024486441|nr:ABC transporter permease [Lysobacter alkalisoli]